MAAGYGQLGNIDGGENGDDDIEDDDNDDADPGNGGDQSYGHGHCACSANLVHQQYVTIIAVINLQVAIIIAILQESNACNHPPVVTYYYIIKQCATFNMFNVFAGDYSRQRRASITGCTKDAIND